MSKKKILVWIFSVLITLSVLFYLIMVLIVIPSNLRISCDRYAREQSFQNDTIFNRNFSGSDKKYDFYYKSCFRQSGLEPK